jgi:hypothetical protein
MDYYEAFDESLEIFSLVEAMKLILEIDCPNEAMIDEQIKQVARKIGELSEDTTYDANGKPIFGHQGIDFMITTVLYVFPRYFEKYNLAQFN